LIKDYLKIDTDTIGLNVLPIL